MYIICSHHFHCKLHMKKIMRANYTHSLLCWASFIHVEFVYTTSCLPLLGVRADKRQLAAGRTKDAHAPGLTLTQCLYEPIGSMSMYAPASQCVVYSFWLRSNPPLPALLPHLSTLQVTHHWFSTYAVSLYVCFQAYKLNARFSSAHALSLYVCFYAYSFEMVEFPLAMLPIYRVLGNASMCCSNTECHVLICYLI